MKQYRFNKNEGHAFFFHDDVGFFVKINKKDYDMPIYSITELGKEFFDLIDIDAASRDYLKGFADEIIKNNKDFAIQLGHLIDREDSYFFSKDDYFYEIPIDNSPPK